MLSIHHNPRRLAAVAAMIAVVFLASACGGSAAVDESVAAGAADAVESAETGEPSKPAETGDASAAESGAPDTSAPVPAEAETTSDEPAAATVPELVGDFTTVDGSQIDLNSLQGQDVVLWFWAPW